MRFAVGIEWKLRGALALLVLIAWSNSFGLGIARDGGAVIDDGRIQSASRQNVGLILTRHYWWPNPADHLYRPVTTLTYLLNYSVLHGERNAIGYHALNLLLHLVNVWLLFELAMLLLGRRLYAFCAAAIWAVHPINTEAVTNIAGRADLLATTAVLGGLLLYARKRSAQGSARWLPSIALFVIACLGVFSKENAATLLGLVVLWDLYEGAGDRESIIRRMPFYGALSASLIVMWFVRLRVFRGEPWPLSPFLDNPLIRAGFLTARFTAIKALGRELWLLVFPLRLSSDHSYNDVPLASAGDLWAWVSLAAILAILAIAVVRYRKNDRIVFWCVGFAALTLLPSSNLIVPIGATMAERFLYLPSIAFAIGVTALIFRLKDQRITVPLVAVILVLFTARTWMRNPDWDSDLTISTADIKAAPESFRPHELRARRLFGESPDDNVDEAIREGEAAWAILRTLPPVDNDQRTPARLGVYYRKKGDLSGGVKTAAGHAWYEKSLQTLVQAREISNASEKDFDNAQLAHGLPLSFRLADDVLYFNLAATYAELGLLSQSLDALRYERGLNPSAPQSYDAIARVNIKQGDYSGAAIALDEEALTSGPTQDIVATLQEVYARLPGGDCAFMQDSGGGPRLNPACPGVLDRRCGALLELKRVFTEARSPATANQYTDLADKQGCSAVSPSQ